MYKRQGQFDFLPSILFICWVAVGGRGTLWGAVAGAIAVNWARVTVSAARPDDWQYLQGLLFVLVLAFVPGGLAGVVRSLWHRAAALRKPEATPATSPAATPAEVTT